MNEYEITHTPKVGPAKEPSDGMNPKHDRGLCAVSDAQLPQLLNNQRVIGFKTAEEAVKFWNSLKSEFRPEPTNLEKYGPDLRKVIKAYAREILCVDDPSFFAYKIQTLEDFCRWAISKPLGGAK